MQLLPSALLSLFCFTLVKSDDWNDSFMKPKPIRKHYHAPTRPYRLIEPSPSPSPVYPQNEHKEVAVPVPMPQGPERDDLSNLDPKDYLLSENELEFQEWDNIEDMMAEEYEKWGEVDEPVQDEYSEEFEEVVKDDNEWEREASVNGDEMEGDTEVEAQHSDQERGYQDGEGTQEGEENVEGEDYGLAYENWGDDDTGTNNKSLIVLPSDVYSQEYLEALKTIGVNDIVIGAKGITYSFYTTTGSCKTHEEIKSDVERLRDFEVIRIYDTDCDGAGTILRNMAPYQKLFAGIYYFDNIEASVNYIAHAVAEDGQGDWNKIYTVSIGNEVVNFGEYNPGQVEEAVMKTRALLREKGYEGPVVSVDTLVATLNNKKLCEVSDYIAVNSHPYWDGNVRPQEAGPWLKEQLAILDQACGRNGKQILVTETGWPTRGQKFGDKGVPSKDNQLIALKSIVETLGDDVILFTASDDYWKQDGSQEVEKFWGILEG